MATPTTLIVQYNRFPLFIGLLFEDFLNGSTSRQRLTKAHEVTAAVRWTVQRPSMCSFV